MAADPALSAFEWLVSPLLNKLWSEAFKHLGISWSEQRKIVEGLEGFSLPTISLAIEIAERSPRRSELKNCLERLKEAYYEADDAVDLFEYEKLKLEVMNARNSFTRKMIKKAKRGLNCVSFLVPRDDSHIKEKIGSYIKVVREFREYHEFLVQQDVGDAGDSDRSDTYHMHYQDPVGRDDDRDKIVSLLMKEPMHSVAEPNIKPTIPIIAITGPAGVGKTTLAHYVYMYMKDQKFFDQFIWMRSPRKFLAADVVKNLMCIIGNENSRKLEIQLEQLISQLSKRNPSSSLSRTAISSPDNMEFMEGKIKQILGTKKFLLVLDDFWCDSEEDEEQWEIFRGCLNSNLPGSKILITTQSTGAANQIGVLEENMYQLGQLEDGPFLKLFMEYAFPSKFGTTGRRDFEEIGAIIAQKLKHDPYAAKLLGSQLRKRREILYWQEISRKDWSGDDMKPRMWSYRRLPAALKRCFALFALFPKGSSFKGSMLINLWIAQGFIKHDNKGERMEVIGQKYLDEMIARFFLVSEDGEVYYVPDLMHDLAEQVSGDDCIRIECNKYGRISLHTTHMLSQKENIHHLFLEASLVNKVKDQICKQKNLRTLVVTGRDETISKKVLQDIFRSSEKLRVVLIPSSVIDELPDSIGNLKHLRYLDMSDCSIQKLPDSICRLYHLQVLHLLDCDSIPKYFSELTSLRYFYTSEETISKISNVGMLTSLQELSGFHVMDKDGYELQQLENLSEIQGLLHIKGLENVKSVEDAVKAKIEEKIYLEGLELEWNGEVPTDDAEILEALQPHPYIRQLDIKRFRGKRLPNWLLNQNSGQNLESFCLWDCTEVEDLSIIHQCMPNCRSVVLSQLDSLRAFPTLPPKLTDAIIELPRLLTFVSADDLNLKEERKRSTLEVAQQITKHPWLGPADDFLFVITEYLQSVRKRIKAVLEIPDRGIKWQELLMRLENIDSLSDASPHELSELWIMCMDCELETMFDTDDEVRLVLPSSLTRLIMAEGSIINQALSSSLHNLVLLTELHLYKILTITSLPPKQVLRVLSNIQSIKVVSCYLLTSLGGIQALTALKKLKLAGCPELNASDVLLPSTLEKIKIEECADVDVLIEKSNLPNLHYLQIWYCSMQKIHLTHLFSLKYLSTVDCPKLFSLEGLSSLSGLESLQVWNCPWVDSLVDKYPYPLYTASIDDPSKLTRILSDESIATLETLQVFGVPEESIDDGAFRNLTSLRILMFSHCQITSLPSNLGELGTLKLLNISDCECLRRLPVLPKSLIEMKIEGCPILKKRCRRNGPDRDKIAHIRQKYISW